jgi:hypothetical protein
MSEMAAEATVAVVPVPRSGRRLPLTPYESRGGLSVSDLMVIIGGIALLIAGWALQRAHDARLESVTVAGLQVAYPEGWLPLPALPPAVAQWTDDRGSGATLTLYAEPAPAEGTFQARSPNPAVAQAAYTPLRSVPVTMDGVPAIRSEYAFARQQVATSTPPEIVRGRDVSWTAGGQRYVLALEAPEDEWSRVEPLFASLATVAVAQGDAG